MRISIGGTIASPGAWNIPSDAPHPSDVSVSNGKVSYRLMNREGSQQWGLMIVEMLAADRLRVEVFENNTGATADFDDRAQMYVR